jgi:hypothetical protein
MLIINVVIVSSLTHLIKYILYYYNQFGKLIFEVKNLAFDFNLFGLKPIFILFGSTSGNLESQFNVMTPAKYSLVTGVGNIHIGDFQ